MTALVPELVNAAIDTSISLGDLLRRALVVARRLAIPELVEWLNSELNGYDSESVPAYRRIQGQLMAENPFRGTIPFFPSPDIVELLSDFEVRQSAFELIRLAQNPTSVFSHFPPNVEHTLMKMMQESNGITMRPVLKFSPVQVQGVIEKVRSQVLDFALDLESKGVLGEGMSFSQEEKQIVQQQHYHFQDVNGSQIQIGSERANQTMTQTNGDMSAVLALIDLLHDSIEREHIAEDARNELQAELATLQAQAASPKPKWPIIKATVSSIKAILENTAGGMLATQLLPYLNAIL